MFGSGNGEESAVLAARPRFGLAMSFMPVSRLARMVALYKAEAQRCGWSPAADQVLYRGICAYGENGAANAFAMAEAQAAATGEEAPLIVRGPFFTGGTKDILRQMESLRDAGVGAIDLDIGGASGGVDYAEKAQLLERFGR